MASAEQMAEAVERLAAMHRDHLASASPSQKFANWVTRGLGRPAAIIIVFIAAAAWVAGNLSASLFHARAVEPAPFPDLALVLGFIAVIVALLILSTQQHTEKLAERRAELTLQMAILAEGKVAKVIALLEEQRAENPLLASRRDVEAEQMAQNADTAEALSRIESARPISE